MHNKFSILVLLLLLFSVTSCFEQPEFKGFSNFQLDEFNKNIVKFNIDVSVFNPNGFSLKVRRSKFDVFINDQFIGKARLLKKVKMKRKKETTSKVPIELTLEEGVLFKVIALARSSKKIDLRLKGPLKASASIIPVRKKIDETKTIDLGELNLKGMGGLN